MKKSFPAGSFNAAGIKYFLTRPMLICTRKSLLLLLYFFIISGNMYAQQITVRGKVVESGRLSPLVGATVTVAGKPGGTITGTGGVFSIKAAVGDQLSVEYIGYA